MYSPSIITTEPALLPLPVAKGLISSVLPLDSFSEGTPCLVEIEPSSFRVYSHSPILSMTLH